MPPPDLAVSSDRAWAEAARVDRRIGHRVEFHPSIPSTNDRARELLDEPGGEGWAVVADVQTAGRGRRGRTWLSPPGVNILCSVAFRPALPVNRAWWIGAAAALAACRAASDWSRAWVRWPNDIVTDDGRKLAGLLVETSAEGDSLRAAVVGIGTNVNWRRADMPDGIRAGSTSLAEVAERDVDRVAYLGRLLDELNGATNAIENGVSPLEAYRSASWLTGRLVEVDTGETRRLARATGIGEDGGLLLEGVGSVSAGEVVRVVPHEDPDD